MDTIAPGTLCLLVGNHVNAGHFCTVLGFEASAPCYMPPTAKFLGMRPVYAIEMSDGRRTASGGYVLGAFRRHLMPVSRPSLSASVAVITQECVRRLRESRPAVERATTRMRP